MKTQQYIVLGVLTLVFGLYQNFSLIRFGLTPLDKDNRKTHARELLGKAYSGSNADLASSLNDIHMSIYYKVRERLPEKFKTQSMIIAQAIIEHSEFYELDPIFTLSVIQTESQFNPLAKGSVGEIGLMQLKPETAEWIAKREGLWWAGKQSLENPVINIAIGTAYLNYLRNNFGGHANKHLAAYNMGPKNVRRIYASEKKPKEYPMKVMKYYTDFYLKLINEKSTKVAEN